MTPHSTKRFWEIDTMRGVAICLMVFYHLLFDLHFFYQINFFGQLDRWKFMQITIGALFLILAGISLVLKNYSLENRGIKNIFWLFAKRGSKIFLLGMVLTIFTRQFIENGIIIFGILHLIGVSTILAYLFIKKPTLSLIIAGIILLFNVSAVNIFNEINIFLPLGGSHNSISMIDYYSIIPWFAFVLIGIFLGDYFYKSGLRQFKLSVVEKARGIKSLSFLGRHALFIYFVHQPIIFLLLSILLQNNQ